MSEAITLYAHWVSQPSRAVGWFCLINNIGFNFECIDFFKGEHLTDKFQQFSPNGLVPVITDSTIDLTLAESNSILQYLAEKEKTESWFPSDPKQRALVVQYLHWHHSNTRKLTTVLFKPVLLAALGLGPDVDKEKATETITPTLEKIDAWLAEGSFLCGTSSPTIADLACFCEIDQLKLFQIGKLGRFPAIQQWVEKMEKLPCYDESHKGLIDFYNSSKDKFESLAS